MSKQVPACPTSSPPPSQPPSEPSAEVQPRRPSTSSSSLPASAAASSSRSLGQRYPPRCRLSRQMFGSARDPQPAASGELPQWTPPPVVVDIYGSDLEHWLHAAAPAEGFGDRAATPPAEQRAASPPPSTTSAAEVHLPGDRGQRGPPNALVPGGAAAPAEGGGDRAASPPFDRRAVSPTTPHTPGGACAEGTHPTLTEGAAAIRCGSTEGNHRGECPEPSPLGLSQGMPTADDEDRNHLVALLAGAPMMGPTAADWNSGPAVSPTYAVGAREEQPVNLGWDVVPEQWPPHPPPCPMPPLPPPRSPWAERIGARGAPAGHWPSLSLAEIAEQKVRQAELRWRRIVAAELTQPAPPAPPPP
eukprot:EG_transcript_11172